MIFPNGRVHRYMKEMSGNMRFESGSSLYMTGALEGVCRELLVRASKRVVESGRARIVPSDLMFVFRSLDLGFLGFNGNILQEENFNEEGNISKQTDDLNIKKNLLIWKELEVEDMLDD